VAELVFAASPAVADANAPPALVYDLGGTLPLVQVDLRLPQGTRVAPVRLQARARESEPWRDVAATVFYRFERGGELPVSPPLALRTHARWLRVLPDARAGTLDAPQTRLVVHAQLAKLVFVSQGQPPYTLLAGAEGAAPHQGIDSLAIDRPAARARLDSTAIAHTGGTGDVTA